MDIDKVKAILDRKEPLNVKDVQIWLGSINFYRKFVANIARHIRPLTDLLNKKSKWKWGEEEKASFDEVKKLLTTHPILRIPDFSRMFIVDCDASEKAVGAILGQNDDNGIRYANEYQSRVLKGAELNYTVTEKELLAVILALTKFRVYLLGRKFKIYTDHVALQWIINLKDPIGRLYRWAVLIQQFDFEIVYKKGSTHTNADALSRPVFSIVINQDDYNKDIYKNKLLLWFVMNKVHANNTSKALVKKIEADARHYNYNSKGVFYRKMIAGIEYLKVPKIEEREDIILRHHDLGHFSPGSTYDSLKVKYYWYKMLEQVAKVLEKCEVCLRNNKVKIFNHPAVAIEANNVFDFIHVDYIFGLPETETGQDGIILFTDKTSRWASAYAVADKSAETTLARFKKWIFTYGTPKVILTDKGTEFQNNIIDKLCKDQNIEHRITASYNPRVNGQVERLNQTLITSLRKHSENKTSDWDKWLDFVVFAYNTRVHSATSFSPYELVFGKKANIFESNDKEELTNSEKFELEQRRNQIRNLQENIRSEASLNSKKAKEVQKENQDKNQNVKLVFLKPGTVVYLKNDGIIPKLDSRYKGPYTVLKRDDNDNYLLKDSTGTEVDDKFPLSKLKIVKLKLNKNSTEIEKILDHKTVKNKLRFLVKWKNQDKSNNSWEPESNFDSKVLINKYWESIQKSKPQRQSTRIKNANLALFLFSVLLPLLLSIVGANELNKTPKISKSREYLVPGKYKFCPYQTISSYPIDLEKICELPEPRNESIRTTEFRTIVNSQLTFSKNNTRFVHLDVYTKVLNSVSGIGYECSQVRNHVKFTETIILNRFELNWKEHVQLTDLDCSRMVKYKECGKNKNKMDCVNKICSYTEEIKPEFSWGQSITKSGDECLFREKSIIAVDKNSPLFGTTCKGSDLHCQVGPSMIVWNNSIVHSCPFSRIMRRGEFKVIEEGFISNEKNLNFIYKKNEDWCGTKIMSTVEGVYLKFADFSSTDDLFYKHTGIEESTDQVDLKQIAELTLSSLDFDLRLETDLARKEFEQSCQNFKVILEVFRLATNNQYLLTKNFKNKKLVVYSKSKYLYKADCTELNDIVIPKKDKTCYENHIKIKFLSKEGLDTSGYLNNEGIITNINPKIVKCDYVNVKLFDTGLIQVIKRLGQYNSLLTRDALDALSVKFAFDVKINVNHGEVLNESFNVLGEINSQVEKQENIFRSPKFSKNIEELRKTVSGLINWTENQTILTYMVIALVLIGGSLIFFGILINRGISPCQCFTKSFLCVFKAFLCCFKFYCCNKRFRQEPTVNYNRNEENARIQYPSAPPALDFGKWPRQPTTDASRRREFQKLLNNN